MFDWLRKKDEIEILKYRYKELMKKSFKLALTDKKRSDLAKEQAHDILEKIQYLKMKIADK